MLVRVRNSKPDVVFMCSLAIEGALLMRQSQELNLTPKVFVGAAQGFTISQFMLAAGGASDYVYSIDLWSPMLPYAGAQKYFDDYVTDFCRPSTTTALKLMLACRSLPMLSIAQNL